MNIKKYLVRQNNTIFYMDGQHKLCEYICLKCYLRILFICEIYILIINVLSNKKTSGCPLKSTLKGQCYKIFFPPYFLLKKLFCTWWTCSFSRRYLVAKFELCMLTTRTQNFHSFKLLRLSMLTYPSTLFELIVPLKSVRNLQNLPLFEKSSSWVKIVIDYDNTVSA